MRGKGVPHLRGGMPGDLTVRIVFEVPQRLDRKQRELLEEFQKISTTANYPDSQRLQQKSKVFFSHRDKLRKK
jgi:molecular chaperone DnaJ